MLEKLHGVKFTLKIFIGLVPDTGGAEVELFDLEP